VYVIHCALGRHAPDSPNALQSSARAAAIHESDATARKGSPIVHIIAQRIAAKTNEKSLQPYMHACSSVRGYSVRPTRFNLRLIDETLLDG